METVRAGCCGLTCSTLTTQLYSTAAEDTVSCTAAYYIDCGDSFKSVSYEGTRPEDCLVGMCDSIDKSGCSSSGGDNGSDGGANGNFIILIVVHLGLVLALCAVALVIIVKRRKRIREEESYQNVASAAARPRG